MRNLIVATLCLACSTVSAGLAEFGIEGYGVVSTPDVEIRASVSADGQQIVWGSTDRKGGAGGWDLWQATRRDERWVEPTPLTINSTANDFDPLISADGHWLYFFSNRDGGVGGDDLYRAPRKANGTLGDPENLGAGVNSAGNEWAPTPSNDGQHLMFASDGFGGAGRHDLLVAHWNGRAFVDPKPVPGINSTDDEFDAAWLDNGKAIVYAHSKDADNTPIRLMVSRCDGSRYVDPQPLALSFNTDSNYTLGPVADLSRPGELLLSGIAPSPKAGKLDIYRMRAPQLYGLSGCVR